MSTYLQITNRCNMSCAHCCFACTALGEDMQWATFMRALSVIDLEDFLTIGGGEPTLHPQFEQMLWEIIKKGFENLPLIITNGSNTPLCKTLMSLHLRKIIYAEISLDEWHDPIDYEIQEMYTEEGNVRAVTQISKNGRASDWGWENNCGCYGGPLIVPNGNIYPCGCMQNCMGNIMNVTPKQYSKIITTLNEHDNECIRNWQSIPTTRPCVA